MKKAFVLLLALAILGGAVFAEDMAYTLKGSATLVWGYDLNTEAHGFTNSTTAELDLWWVAKQASTHGEEPITGSITIKDFKAGIDNGALSTSNGTVTAKILFPSNLYLQIASAPTFEVNYAELFAPITEDDWDPTPLFLPEIVSAGGFTVGMTGDFSFALKVGSTNKHTTVGNDDYHVGLDLGYKLGDLAAFDASFIYGSFKDDPAMVGLGLKATATPIENLDLLLAADMELVDDAFGYMDFLFTADYELPELLSFGTGAYVILNTEATSGNPLMAAKVRVGVLAVENLVLDFGADFFDVLDTADLDNDILIGLSVNTSYKAMLDDVNYVKPYLKAMYLPEYNAAEALTTLSVGVEAMLIPLTTFTLDFSAGELDVDSWYTGTGMGSDVGQDKGVITFTTKISY